MKYMIWLIMFISYGCGQNKVKSNVNKVKAKVQMEQRKETLRGHIKLEKVSYIYGEDKFSRTEFTNEKENVVSLSQVPVNKAVDMFDARALRVKLDFTRIRQGNLRFIKATFRLKANNGKVLGEGVLDHRANDLTFDINNPDEVFKIIASQHYVEIVELQGFDNDRKPLTITYPEMNYKKDNCFYGKVIIKTDEEYIDRNICHGTEILYKGRVRERKPRFKSTILEGAIYKLSLDYLPVNLPGYEKTPVLSIPKHKLSQGVTIHKREFYDDEFRTLDLHDSRLTQIGFGRSNISSPTSNKFIRHGVIRGSAGLRITTTNRNEMKATGLIEIISEENELIPISLIKSNNILFVDGEQFEHDQGFLEYQEYTYSSKATVEYIAVKAFNN